MEMGALDKLEKANELLALMKVTYDDCDDESDAMLFQRLEDTVVEFTGEENMDKVNVLVWEFLKGTE